MAGAYIQVDAQEVNAALARLQAAGARLRPLFLEAGEELLQSTRARFASQTDPDGRAWAPLSLRYLASSRKRRSRGPNAILTLSGDLARDLHYQASDTELRLGSSKKYAATHQFGRGRIPTRPFLGLAADDRATVLELAADYFERAASGS
jgi:phage virion morphogenesis protein